MNVGLKLESRTIGLDLQSTSLGVKIDPSGNPVGVDIHTQSTTTFTVVNRTGDVLVTGATTLLGLSDVDAPSFDVGDTPVWDGTKFEGQPASGGISEYIHTQSSPDTTWTIIHNRGRRVSVTAMTVGGVTMRVGVQQVSPFNQVVLSLSTPLAGFAIIE